jgi:sec-independent protein translocase protein TatA
MGELFLIFLVVLLIFGASQIPKVAKGLGQGMREFKRAAREMQEDDAPPAEKPAAPKNDTP